MMSAMCHGRRIKGREIDGRLHFPLIHELDEHGFNFGTAGISVAPNYKSQIPVTREVL